MTRALRVALLLLTALAGATAQAAGPKPFVAGSMQQIRAAHAGRPFLLALWSLTCSHCQEELAQLGKLHEQRPELNVVLVSTSPTTRDTHRHSRPPRAGARRSASVRRRLRGRLRFEIDPRWGGSCREPTCTPRIIPPAPSAGSIRNSSNRGYSGAGVGRALTRPAAASCRIQATRRTH